MQMGAWLKVKVWNILRFCRRNSDIKWLLRRLPHLTRSVPPPELACELRWPAHQSWMPRHPSSLLVHLKMQVVTLIIKCAVKQNIYIPRTTSHFKIHTNIYFCAFKGTTNVLYLSEQTQLGP